MTDLRPVHELRGCQLLRHDVRPRTVGDLVGSCCHDCGVVWFTESQPVDSTLTAEPPSLGSAVSGRPRGLAPAARAG